MSVIYNNILNLVYTNLGHDGGSSPGGRLRSGRLTSGRLRSNNLLGSNGLLGSSLNALLSHRNSHAHVAETSDGGDKESGHSELHGVICWIVERSVYKRKKFYSRISVQACWKDVRGIRKSQVEVLGSREILSTNGLHRFYVALMLMDKIRTLLPASRTPKKLEGEIDVDGLTHSRGISNEEFLLVFSFVVSRNSENC